MDLGFVWNLQHILKPKANVLDSLYWSHDPLLHQEKEPRELGTGKRFRLTEESLHEVQKGELLLLSCFGSLGRFAQEDFCLVLAEQAKGSVMAFKRRHPSFSSPLYRP